MGQGTGDAGDKPYHPELYAPPPDHLAIAPSAGPLLQKTGRDPPCPDVLASLTLEKRQRTDRVQRPGEGIALRMIKAERAQAARILAPLDAFGRG